MLTNEIQLESAVGIRPQPTFGSVKSCTIVVAARKIPEGYGHRISGHPLPVFRILPIPNRSEPVLPVGVTLVTPPQLPGEKSLQRRIRFVDQGTPPRVAKVEGPLEVGGLLVVEDVALAVVGGGAARRLIAESWTSFNGQSLKK